ncbi:MAG: glucose-6-phosphate isomerase [Alphaproteobacteria bacterium]
MVHYAQDIDGCLVGAIGAHGLEPATLAALIGECDAGLDRLRARHADGGMPLLRLPAERDDIDAVAELAALYREGFDHVVVLGTGGSSLGGQTLVALAESHFGPRTGAPRLHFMDNVDPHSFAALFDALAPSRTAFIVISKSGGTAETLTQFFVCLEHWRARVGEAALPAHFLVITEPGDNPLRRAAARWDLPVLDHDPGVGGRFAALSLVGLLPAMIAGLDAGAVRAGAAAVLDPILAGAVAGNCPPAAGAALAVGLGRARGIGTTVLMPYVDRLAHFGMWYRQLWAESLGKAGRGTTPVRAMGTVDQHSQLQLYLDGPRDKMFTVLALDTVGAGEAVPSTLAEGDSLAYLAGRRMGDLLDAEARATADTLIRNARPTRRISLARLDEEVLGALMMHFMLETILAADLLGVDAFDQPAVEEGKILTRDYLARMAAT